MRLDRVVVAFAQLHWEVARQIPLQQRIVRKLGLQQFLVRDVLRISQQHGDFRPRQTDPHGIHRIDRLVIRQELDRPVQGSGALQRPHQPLVPVKQAVGLAFGHRDRLSLSVIVLQTQRRHIVCHFDQHIVALFFSHIAAPDDLTQSDLDIDLVVGTIDAGGIVDRVAVDPAAGPREFDSAQLCRAQVSPLADNLAAQFATVDAQPVIGPIAGVAM